MAMHSFRFQRDLSRLRTMEDAQKVIDSLKALGYWVIEYGDYSDGTAYAVYKHNDGSYVGLDYTWHKVPGKRDAYEAGEILAFDTYANKEDYEKELGYAPRESFSRTTRSYNTDTPTLDYFIKELENMVHWHNKNLKNSQISLLEDVCTFLKEQV